MKIYNKFKLSLPSISHISRGGTAIGNFDISQLELYENAIKQSKMQDILCIGEPMDNWPNMKALHFKNRSLNRDLSNFWRIFDKLKTK